MKRPLVSFVIPCYNYGRFLVDAISSVLNQIDYSDFEVIVINDASTDETAQVIAQFKDPRVIAIHHPKNQGHVITINEGLERATGTFVSRIDADDRIAPTYLRDTIPHFQKDPELGAIYGAVNLIDSAGQITVEKVTPHGPRPRRANILLDLLFENFICAPTLVARNELWKKALPIPTGFAHSDWYFNLMLAREASFLYIDKVLADYRVHGNNHHTVIAMNKSEEPTTFRILDMMYQQAEGDPQLEWQKQKIKRKVYAQHYATLTRRYFGAKHYQDSWRCYLEAAKWDPKMALDPQLARLQIARFIGGERYHRFKQIARKLKS